MTQTKIVLACCIFHNFIVIEEVIQPNVEIEEDDDIDTYGMTQQDRDDMGKFWDEIAQRMWEDYRSQH